MSDRKSNHYNENYFAWQKSIGEFGGRVDQNKFIKYISCNNKVLDFGCGGGYLLKNIKCIKRVGVEINPSAVEIARQNGIEVFSNVEDLPDGYFDIIISDNALEHTLQPLLELKELYKKLVLGGKIIFVVPCESFHLSYYPNNISYHLYSWSPMCIGNLFSEAGFSIIESKAYRHKWPPYYRFVARMVGFTLFDILCRIYDRIDRSWFQVRIIAERKNA